MKNAGFMTRALRNVKGAVNNVAERAGIKTASKFGAEFMAKHSGIAKGLAKAAKFAPVIGMAGGAWDIYDSITETNKIKEQGEIAENDNAFKLERLDRQMERGATDIATTAMIATGVGVPFAMA